MYCKEKLWVSVATEMNIISVKYKNFHLLIWEDSIIHEEEKLSVYWGYGFGRGGTWIIPVEKFSGWETLGRLHGLSTQISKIKGLSELILIIC